MAGPQVPSVGPTNARIMIVGEAPGEQEILQHEPFVGSSGLELTKMLQEAGIMRSECFVTNVVRERPPGNDMGAFIPTRKKDITQYHVEVRGRKVLPCVRDGVELLRREIELVKPNVIIALGNTPLWALTGKSGITSWRGSLLTCDLGTHRCKVIPAVHPALILRQWTWRGIALLDLKRAQRESLSPEIPHVQYAFVSHPSYIQAWERLTSLITEVQLKPTKLSVDIETRAGHIACIGLAWSSREALCIPLMSVEKRGAYWLEAEETELQFLLYQLLTHPNCHVIGQNFLYDAQYFYRHLHYVPNLVRDTMISQHSCFSNMQKGLDFLASMYCEHYVYWKEESKDWDPKVGERQLWEYNCKDAVITFEVDEALQRTVDALGVRKPHDFQQSMFRPVLNAMIRGVRVDSKVRGDFAVELQKEIAARQQWFKDVLGHPLNPRSGPQMQKLFYQDLSQRIILKRETKKPTLDDKALTTIALREPLLLPLIRKIAEFRSLGVFLGTFVSAPVGFDGRMRSSYNIAGTVTYRLSSSKDAFGSGMNLQNIPKGGDTAADDDTIPGLELPNVRKLFTFDPGKGGADLDLSKADLRVVTWESDEPAMKAMLKEGRDPYLETAREFYRKPEITKESGHYYQTFKSFAHGTHYLATPKGLAHNLGLTVHEVDRTQKWYFGKFPRIKAWQDDFREQVLKRRYVQNIFGYKVHVIDRIEDSTFKELIAWVPQSTVGLYINHIWRMIENELPWMEVLLQVHDSLLFQFAWERRDEAALEVKTRAAKIVLPYDDPLTIPVGLKMSNESWGACG